MMMDTTRWIIRPESITDYPDIGLLQARAFGNRAGEALIIALLRQRRAFDPELSLVAETNGRVVGHVLFSPHQMRLLNQVVRSVNLAPIAVDPVYQGRGIGGQLIIEGHKIAAAKGYTVSILLGHTSYYPRFGYHTHAFGSAQVVVPINAHTDNLLDVHSPTSEDVPDLYELWRHEEENVDMTFEPELDLLDWLSPNPAVRATVYTRNSQVVGYTRIHTGEPTRPQVFLAPDHEAARAMVATMARQLRADTSGTEYILPLHPSSASAQAFGHATCKAMAAAMACSLGSSPLDDYLAQVRSEQRPPGRPIWPVAFDLG
jgi:putative acetyltransferase